LPNPSLSAILLPKRNGFYCCPGCRKKLIRITPGTEADRLPVYCHNCRREIYVDIHRGQCFQSRSPDHSDE